MGQNEGRRRTAQSAVFRRNLRSATSPGRLPKLLVFPARKRILLARRTLVSARPLLLAAVMDALIAKADAIRPANKRRKTAHHTHRQSSDNPTAASVSQHTALPRSLRPSSPPPEEAKKYSHIHNKKLRTELFRQSAQNARSKRLFKDAELLLTEDAGLMEVEGELEKTWRVSQNEITGAAGQQAAQGRQEWKMDGGPYRTRYTRNGRSLCHIHVEKFKTLTHIADISLSLARKAMLRLLTGRQERFIPSCNYKRHVAISR